MEGNGKRLGGVDGERRRAAVFIARKERLREEGRMRKFSKFCTRGPLKTGKIFLTRTVL